MAKIKIGEVYETSAAICVPYEFDTGENGQINFPRNTSNEEIVRFLKEEYARVQRAKTQTPPDRKNLPRSINI